MIHSLAELRIVYPREIAYRLGDSENNRISYLRWKHDAGIYVSECIGPHGYISIVAATNKIVKIFSELVWKFVGPLILTAGKLEERKVQRTSPYVRIKFLVPNDIHSVAAGNVLTLDRIGQKSNTKIVFYSVDCPMSTDRLVEITGTPTDCIKCVKELLKLIKSDPETHFDRICYEPANTPFFIKDYVNKLEGNANGGIPYTLFRCDYRLDALYRIFLNDSVAERTGLGENSHHEGNTALGDNKRKRKLHRSVSDENDVPNGALQDNCVFSVEAVRNKYKKKSRLK